MGVNRFEMDNKEEKIDLAAKLFDESNYASMIINTEAAAKKHQEEIKHLIDLVSKEKNKSALPELYKVLKAEKASIHLVIDALETKDGIKHSKALYACIWESDLNASEYIVDLVKGFFVSDIETCIEIFTVITNNCETVKEDDIDDAIDVFKEYAPLVAADKKELSLEILDWLENSRK
jgi:hypothetical protein